MSDARAAEVFREVMLMESPPTATPTAAVSRSFVFGDVWERPGLSRRDRRWVTLTSVAAGTSPAPLDSHVYAALASGDISVSEMLEFVLHFAAYCGFSKASQLEMALTRQWARLHEQRGEPAPPWPALEGASSPPADEAERRERARQVRAEVTLLDAPQGGTPFSEAGVLGFVFGQVWERPGLGRRERRIITVTCTAVSGATVPMQSHVKAALHSGDLTKEEMDEMVLHFSVYNGFSLGSTLGSAVEAAWASRP